MFLIGVLLWTMLTPICMDQSIIIAAAPAALDQMSELSGTFIPELQAVAILNGPQAKLNFDQEFAVKLTPDLDQIRPEECHERIAEIIRESYADDPIKEEYLGANLFALARTKHIHSNNLMYPFYSLFRSKFEALLKAQNSQIDGNPAHMHQFTGSESIEDSETSIDLYIHHFKETIRKLSAYNYSKEFLELTSAFYQEFFSRFDVSEHDERFMQNFLHESLESIKDGIGAIEGGKELEHLVQLRGKDCNSIKFCLVSLLELKARLLDSLQTEDSIPTDSLAPLRGKIKDCFDVIGKKLAEKTIYWAYIERVVRNLLSKLTENFSGDDFIQLFHDLKLPIWMLRRRKPWLI